MVYLNWSEAYESLEPHIVKIRTPQGMGTGFLLARSKDNILCGIATAAHVVDHAHYWEQPIRIHHSGSGDSILLRNSDRSIILDEEADTGVIMFGANKLQLPDTPFELSPEDMYLKVGNEVGWMGFPSIALNNLCFFSGRVSSVQEGVRSYLVDGVAVNGVSGGPAIFNGGNKVVVIGVVSAYLPNRVAGTALPGLVIIQDVTPFQGIVQAFQSLNEAKANEPEPEPPKNDATDDGDG